MTEAMTDLPPGAVLAETWEQCARHVEAGGIVEVRVSWGAWEREWLTPRTYRRRNGAPGGSTWVARRLVPGESAAPANGVPVVPTGAERYLAERLADPEYRDAYEAAAPAAGDDLRERIARAIWEDDERAKRDESGDWDAKPPTDHEVYLRNADAVLAVLSPQPTPSPVPPWPGDDDWCGAVLNDLNSIIHQHCGSDGSDDAHCDWVNDLANEVVRYFQRPDVLPAPPPVPSWPDGVLRDAANRLRWIANSGYIEDPGIKRIIRSWADELDATLVPPWPGAVLSGLTDEDGVPTWLAQAGQVRGEMVRDTRGAVWTPCALDDNLHQQAWVEVRAPRAVPEPETERVPWWEAVGRGLAGSKIEILEVGMDAEGPWVRVVEGGTKLYSPVAPDGTVEVLKDGES